MRKSLALVLATWCCAAIAQEVVRPLNMQPRDNVRGGQKSGLNTWFLYQNLPQELPLMDDFSIDRTRHLNARPGDAGVTLNTTVYQLEVAGSSTPDMAFATDTTWHYTVDTVGADTIMRTANPNVSVTIYDISTYPSPTSTTGGWPLYNIWDTIGVVTVPDDTIAVAADIMQDSLLVYDVAPDPRTYQFGLATQPLILWENDDAYINGNYPVDPPTIGVATLDGMDRTGLPYTTIANVDGMADALTSVPIDLSYAPDDSIYLSFFYQPQGLSGDDQVQPTDTLMLELYAPTQDEWFREWYTTYTALDDFKQVMLPITYTGFLQNGFRFRFRNRATLNGALDHWHIDYVRLAEQRTFDDTVIVDVAYVYPETTLLETYTTMPFDQYALDPGANMAASKTLLLKNLDVNDRFITFGMQAGLEGGTLTSFNSGTNTSGNANSTFGALHPVDAAPANYQHDPSLSDTCQAFYAVKFWSQTSPDLCIYNDSVLFTQEFSNEFALDDGSAEAGYSLNVNGAKLAQRFDMVGGDSLRALRMYFDPIFSQNDPTDGNFLITVWSSLSPETIVHQDFSFSSPDHVPWGPDHFVEYPLDSAVWVSGTFYVGWTQTNAVMMNLGFDRNRDNSGRIFYKTSTSFANTSQQGTLMIRPVFKSECDPFTGMEEPMAGSVLSLHPNPADAAFTIADARGIARVQLHDATGRMVRDLGNDGPWPVHDLVNGMYLVRTLDASGRTLSAARLMVQH